jgi:hypothetical protein
MGYTDFVKDVDEYEVKHTYELKRAHECVKAVLRDAREAYKLYHDAKIPGAAEPPSFVTGDEVMLYSPRITHCGDCGRSNCRKFQPLWNGPFTIVDISDRSDVYTIRNGEGRILKVKLEDLQRYHVWKLAQPRQLMKADRDEGDEATGTQPWQPDADREAEHEKNDHRGSEGHQANTNLHGSENPTPRVHDRPVETQTREKTQTSESPKGDGSGRTDMTSYEVDHILSHRKDGRRMLYLIR